MTVYTSPQIRVSINNQNRSTIRTVGVAAKTRFKMDEIEDVVAATPESNETLVYDATIQKYVVKALPVIDGGSY